MRRITGNEYRGVWADALRNGGIVLPGKAGRTTATAFVRECLRVQITMDGAKREAELLVEAIHEDMKRAHEAAGGTCVATVWGPGGECVGVGYHVEGNRAVIDTKGLPDWALDKVRVFFEEHGYVEGDA